LDRSTSETETTAQGTIQQTHERAEQTVESLEA